MIAPLDRAFREQWGRVLAVHDDAERGLLERRLEELAGGTSVREEGSAG